MQAMGEHVLAEMPRRAERTEGGVEIPDGATVGEHLHGRVISVGELVTGPIELGDIVLFDPHDMRPLELRDAMVIALAWQSVYCRMREADAAALGLSLDFGEE